MHKSGFFSKISNVKVYFCQVHWIPCFFTDPRMFSLALYPDPFTRYDLSYLMHQNFCTLETSRVKSEME